MAENTKIASNRPWLVKGEEYPSPWDEYSAFETWLDQNLPDGDKDKIDEIGPGVMAPLYALFCQVADCAHLLDGKEHMEVPE